MSEGIRDVMHETKGKGLNKERKNSQNWKKYVLQSKRSNGSINGSIRPVLSMNLGGGDGSEELGVYEAESYGGGWGEIGRETEVSC